MESFERVAIVGLGLLGRNIATCFLANGFEVIGLIRHEAAAVEACREIERSIEELIEHGAEPSLRQTWREHFVTTRDDELLTDADMVVESIAEELVAKRELFDRIEARVRLDVPIASNTSSIPIGLLQQGRKHPKRFLGMHWPEMAHATRFLEVIRGPETSDEVIAEVTRLAHRLGREPCLVQKDVPAFIVNRLAYAMYREALHLLETGVADAETIDRSFRNAAGLWASVCGPLRWIDLSGGPALYAQAMQHVLPTLSNTTEVPDTLARLAEDGARGIVNGRGFYDYTPEQAEEWKQRHREHVWRVRDWMDEALPLTPSD